MRSHRSSQRYEFRNKGNVQRSSPKGGDEDIDKYADLLTDMFQLKNTSID